MTAAPTVKLPDGSAIPRFGVGTWRMGERDSARADELAALRLALDLGVRLIDTAEMYGDGGAEKIVGEALRGWRDDVFVVSKVYPHNASRRGAIEACERSLARLGTDRIDLYLLHWPGEHPIGETVAAFEHLHTAGKIRFWGVSNFDVDEMKAVVGAREGGHCATNQVLYNLAHREPEWALLDWMRKRHMPAMAYSPIDQASLAKAAALDPIAKKHGATPAQIALAWLLRMPDVVTIPKATRPAHLRENLGAMKIALDQEDLAALDRAFPPPRRAARIGVY